MIYKENLKVKKGSESSSQFESFEYSYIYLKNQGTRILLMCIYRKQEIACKTFCQELEKLLDAVSDTTEALLVVGDFNVWSEMESDRDAKKLRTLMSAFGLSQKIEEPTHKKGHTLDHIYHNEHILQLDYQVHTETFGITTDHYPITIRIPCEVKHEEPVMKKIRAYKKIDMETFKKDIVTIVENIVGSDKSFEIEVGSTGLFSQIFLGHTFFDAF